MWLVWKVWWVGWRTKVMSDVGEHVVDPVSKHLDFMSSGATTLTKHVVEVRHVICGCGFSNPGSGCGNSGGGRETQGGGDFSEGPGGQLFMEVVMEFSHFGVPHLRIEVDIGARNVKKNGVEDDDHMVEVEDDSIIGMTVCDEDDEWMTHSHE
ncbi:hypothetical protein Tco_1485724 [Tanacetum coccineum]